MRIDLGTGDGRAVLAAAASDPGRLVIGIDASAAGMIDASRRSLRPRDGLANTLFVVAAAERLPSELDGVADEVTINFPWGSLLRGLLTAEDTVLSGLVRIMKPGAALSILLSVTDQDHSAELPPVTDAGALEALVAPYAAWGLIVTGIRPLSRAEVVAAGSSWGKRLGAGERRPAWSIQARRGREVAERTA
ncbi:class I SAM-dependent methyltransferase [Nocardia sp. CDC159]|uniref:Class I SAM-dependent methyltransferase n=1 Tax=Nocardia pulmonis TaxID=2951408 RepID=A0A9X2EAH5_9NOCA|nr:MULTISPECIES: class I SAM-dependent methyltransferase [Nocardia]MCM6776676.1 class I SAM-dependent methyltransferase [Nocardia pulmonis]MCM6789175.1 class I SAM-dependent methyltransferase [Nocardia sp. CDC159]